MTDNENHSLSEDIIIIIINLKISNFCSFLFDCPSVRTTKWSVVSRDKELKRRDKKKDNKRNLLSKFNSCLTRLSASFSTWMIRLDENCLAIRNSYILSTVHSTASYILSEIFKGPLDSCLECYIGLGLGLGLGFVG